MRILDLFCCEGGAAVGYHRAGWEVVGVDIEPQPRYPFTFEQADALDVLRRLVEGQRVRFGPLLDFVLADFDAIHASPPCQRYSAGTRGRDEDEYPDLIAPTRELLIASGLPYVIENVVGAPLVDPLLLCGSHFGLTATDVDGTRLRLQRHRLFESNTFLMAPGICMHDTRVQVAGAYGAGSASVAAAKERGGGYTPNKAVRAALLGGVDWMTLHGQAQCIPPAYSEWVGDQLMAYVEGARELGLV